ncbi:glutaredoxin family protein [Telluria mixta]|uniref:Glutaredoxin family protein n=1 Tax=Telluria mixta TaxID=34071 RepID=A0ABT2C2B5_9BURK|nr:glutaredoxin family protein [Telluria mixta]MCS0630814.1 glutaredoxin family protein [Telluria mixta]WEM98816.1 glutaredoxin family protein [Telluria mixta]
MRALAAFALVVAAAAAHGQTYKWKDAAGVVHYSDTPPAKGSAQVLRPDSRPEAAPSLPYELARAMKLHPVTLYTTARCDACDQGRALLRARGIPFAEKTVNTAEDREQLQRAGGKDELPLLVVGNRPVTGFTAGAWNEALDAASYPRKSVLPPGYRTGASDAAAPAPPPRLPAAPAPDAAAAQAERQQPRQQPQPKKTTPDFQF